MISEELGTLARVVVRKRCASCGARAEFVDLQAGDTVDHRCGWNGTGSTWWVHRRAGR